MCLSRIRPCCPRTSPRRIANSANLATAKPLDQGPLPVYHTSLPMTALSKPLSVPGRRLESLDTQPDKDHDPILTPPCLAAHVSVPAAPSCPPRPRPGLFHICATRTPRPRSDVGSIAWLLTLDCTNHATYTIAARQRRYVRAIDTHLVCWSALCIVPPLDGPSEVCTYASQC